MTELEAEHIMPASQPSANRYVYFYKFSGYGYLEIICEEIYELNTCFKHFQLVVMSFNYVSVFCFYDFFTLDKILWKKAQ